MIDKQLLPVQLIERDQWINWTFQGTRKVPLAKVNDPATWHSFDGIDHNQRIAFVFSSSDPFCGIDLDNCIVDGQFTDEAKQVLDAFRGKAYAEISPSGLGVKLWTMAKKPANSRCQDGNWLEVYDERRYFAITGNCIGEGFQLIGNGQTELDSLVDQYLQIKVAVASQPSGFLHSSSLVERARGYLNAASLPLNGSRNNTLFSLAGHLHAMTDEFDNGLSEPEVVSLMREWNALLPDPLADSEVEQCVKSAKRNGQPRQKKTPDAGFSQPRFSVHDVDISKILETGNSWPTTSSLIEQAVNLNDAIGHYMRWNLSTSYRQQPAFALAGAMALLGVACGRKIRDCYDTRTNCYFLCAGEAGSGKDHARRCNEIALHAAGMSELLSPEELTSDTALAKVLDSHPAALLQADEIGRWLATADPKHSPHHYTLVSMLLKLYSSANSPRFQPKGYADSKSNISICQPHLVLLGTSTPKSLYAGLGTSSLDDGMLSRLSIFTADESAPRRRPTLAEPPTELATILREWREYQPSGNLPEKNIVPTIVEAETEADEILDAFGDECDTLGSVAVKSLWRRAPQKARQYALIRCAARGIGSMRVSVSDATWSVDLARSLTRDLCALIEFRIAASPHEAMLQDIQQFLASHGDSSATQLARGLRKYRAKERTDAIQQLIAEGSVVQVSGEGGRLLFRHVG